MDLNIDTLRRLINGCIEGKASMQKEMYYTYYPILMKIGVRYANCKEDAEQWVHDGFLKIFENLNKFEYKGSFEGWIKKIMVRLCLDKIRAQNAQKNEVNKNTNIDFDEIQSFSKWTVHNQVLEKTSAEEVIHIMRGLPEKQRIVFNLYVFEEYNHKEISEYLSITENHSHWLLHQAKKNLKNIIKTDSTIAV
ncbi:MAG TPA: sigma-70 family RNA polymerase sigma factor [Edaphocola sp.]|nr:sigma-70 family RNA polymerase sigma factor [Edaphocola sp.]